MGKNSRKFNKAKLECVTTLYMAFTLSLQLFPGIYAVLGIINWRWVKVCGRMCVGLCANTMTFYTRGLSNCGVWYLWGGPGTNLPWILRDTCNALDLSVGLKVSAKGGGSQGRLPGGDGVWRKKNLTGEMRLLWSRRRDTGHGIGVRQPEKKKKSAWSWRTVLSSIPWNTAYWGYLLNCTAGAF